MKNMTCILCSEIAERQNIDENRMCESARVRSCLTIFLTAEFRGKRAKLSKLGKKLHKIWEPWTNPVIMGKTFKTGEKTAQNMGAMDQPCYNGFRLIRDRVITALQCKK